MDQLKLVTELEGGNSQWWASLPQEESKFPGSVWVTAEGFFYTLARKIFPTCSKNFVTPVYTMQVWGCLLDTAACSCRLQDVTCYVLLNLLQAEVLKATSMSPMVTSNSPARGKWVLAGSAIPLLIGALA